MSRKFIMHILMLMAGCASAFCSTMDNMAKRLFGDRASEFVFVQTSEPGERYSVSGKDGKICIEGSTPSAMAVGLNRYLRQLCNTDVSWYDFDPVILPANLPLPEQPLYGESVVPSRFFLNYCTYGYTMPYWQWPQWERFIDWMALQGVNMPLATAGQEAVWQRVWRSFGLDDATIRAYFPGPAHLPWHRMLNLDRWDGPLPQAYIDAQEHLQKQIVERCRELGMKPVLPAFAGHVPPELGRVYPQAQIHPMSKWGGLDPEKYRSYFIDPNDSIFSEIQRRFIEEQTKVYGTDHIYGLDPFNEIEVPSWEPDYLRSASAKIYETLADADPQAQWLQMAWMFHYMSEKWTPERIEAFLSGVDPDKMIFLDYYCDLNPLWNRTSNFYGHDFIWCYLGNFGGNSFLVGDMDVVSDRLTEVKQTQLPNFTGVGGTLEGLDANRHMHTYVLDQAWSHDNYPTTASDWIAMWADARGATEDSAIADGWQALYDKIYHATSTSQGTLINARPALTGHSSWTTNNRIKYDNKDLWTVWRILIEAESSSPAHFYDIVNVGRQILGNHFETLRDAFTAAYQQKDLQKMRELADSMDEFIVDYSNLLACHPAFSLDRWLDYARSFGSEGEESDYYERNARHLITTWAQAPGGLNDYANRDLDGLADTFYRKRWRMFTDAVCNAVAEGREWQNADEPFYAALSEWEWNWCDNHDRASLQASTDVKTHAKKLFDKYCPNHLLPDVGFDE